VEAAEEVTGSGESFPDPRVRSRLRTAPHGAIVLERLAYGGGTTNWYVCAGEPEFDIIVSELRPGSWVSFYFDDRIALRAYTPALRAEMLDILTQTGEVQFAHIPIDGIHLDMDIISGPNELAGYTETLGSASVFYTGAFPDGEDDGVNAITVVLPDKDGVVRRHAY
jgi:hypothetical protein